jgi:two-component system, OmpR family, KDP operon response regulator KdpE
MRNLKDGAALPRYRAHDRFFVGKGRIIVASGCAQERKELRTDLELEGHQVAEAETADQTLQETYSGRHHVLILGLGLETPEPRELCRTIRLKSDLGIIVLTGEDTNQRRIDAFTAGADDFLSSPFDLRELLARVRAVLRRVTQSDDCGRQIILEDRAIDLKTYEIRGPGGRVSYLTPKEFLVLQCLVAQANKVCTRQNLAQTVWQRDGQGEVEYLRVVIKQLRRKLEPDPDNPRYILTERSIGYRFYVRPAEESALTELPAQLSLVD